MKLLAFAASNSTQSINKQLVTYATQIAKEKNKQIEVEIIDLNDYEMPIYSSDRENANGIPDLAQTLYAKIGEADSLIISLAEHNGSYTAAFKNIFDWTSRIDMKVYQDTPSVLLATSPGPGGAKNVLASAETSAPHFKMDLKGSLSIPSFYDNFDSEKGAVPNQEINEKLIEVINNLV